MSPKFHLSKWKTYFHNLLIDSSNIEEVEYLIHYVKFNISLFSHYFLMLMLGGTLFPPIYKGIENWDFECCSRLGFPIFLS